MIAYVTVGTDDIVRAERFYSAFLPALGYGLERYQGDLSYVLPVMPGRSPAQPDFYVKKPFDGRPASAGNGVMVAFEARSQRQVRDLHAAALAAGGSNEGKPGFRAAYGPRFYVGYLRDPACNKVALFSSDPAEPGRDADAGAAAAFRICMTAMPHVRPATRADLPRIRAIRHGTSENRLADPTRAPDAEVAWYLDAAIFLVSEDDAGVQGFVCANHQTGLVWALFVVEAAQGRGHGSALLDAALARLRWLGHRQAFLATDPDARAAGFYRARGWRSTGRDLEGEEVFVLALR